MHAVGSPSVGAAACGLSQRQHDEVVASDFGGTPVKGAHQGLLGGVAGRHGLPVLEGLDERVSEHAAEPAVVDAREYGVAGRAELRVVAVRVAGAELAIVAGRADGRA